MNIKLNQIKSAAWNTRGEIKPESVKDLAQSIDEQGLINPITIWMDANGEPVCIAGNRRLAALLSIRDYEDEITESEYKVFDGTEHEAQMVTVTENLQREDVGVIEEAALVSRCLEDGMTAEAIAARTGRSVSWVNRRRRLIALDDAWKNSALPADALERIAALPPDAQKRLAKGYGATESWANVRWAYDREMRDLDSAKFCDGKCYHCANRTGVQPDLFGDVDGKLGRCLDGNCFDKRRAEWVEAEIKTAVGDAEVVRVANAWQMPDEAESSFKRSKKFPCAYVHEYNGELAIKWSYSAAEKKRREEEERKREEAEDSERDAENDREDEIIERLNEWKRGDKSGKAAVGIIELVGKCLVPGVATEVFDFCFDAIADRITGWHDETEWATMLSAFPEIADYAGVSNEDREWFIERYPEDKED